MQNLATKFENLTIQSDFIFKKVMSRKRICIHLLEELLQIKIADINYLEAEKSLEPEFVSRGIRLDIIVADDKNTHYNLEMQVKNTKNPDTKNYVLPKRTRYYQGMLDLDQMDKGMDYTQLKRSFVIFVCTFDPFHMGRHLYTFENRCVEDTSLSLGDATQKIFLNTKGIFDDVRPELKRLLNFIDGKQPEDAFTQKLSEAVESAKRNEKWRLDYMNLQMAYDEKYQEGLEAGMTESAKRMLSAGKYADTEISEITGLSLEQIQQLKESSIKAPSSVS